MKWYVTRNKRKPIPTVDIPVLDYTVFFHQASSLLGKNDTHCIHYFGQRQPDGLKCWCLLADDSSGEIFIAAWKTDDYEEKEFPSLTAVHYALHPFEREMTENFGIRFAGNPYDKPLRFSHDRADRERTINNYPFYRIDSPDLHDVHVGPIHAGVIEPGAFRFVCNGEKILHMEVVLGYQHRGMENLLIGTENSLRQTVLAESIAGDTAVSHATAFCHVVEGMHSFSDPSLDKDRGIGQELERIAMHLGDTGALCMDVGFQLGQVACEALRTIAVNTMLRWCGNRFGKGLVRPFGTPFPLTRRVADDMVDSIKEIRRRYREICEDLFTSPSVLGRFEECGTVSREQMEKIGGVGMAARASGICRDIRSTHPYGLYADFPAYDPVVMESGDVMARASVRYREVMESIEYLLKILMEADEGNRSLPLYHHALPANTLSLALLEGWRGEICHVGITDDTGRLITYKIKDPSLHNWYALSLAVRNIGISDFPVNNKSFNLSYCGFDL